jgi:hypothetical protein
MTIREKAEYVLKVYGSYSRASDCAQYILDSIPADDGEPVTEEWLRSMTCEQQGVGMIFRLPEGVAYHPRVLAISCYHDGPPRAYLELQRPTGNDVIPLGDASTRGQVRLLLKALGITPNSKDGGE